MSDKQEADTEERLANDSEVASPASDVVRAPVEADSDSNSDAVISDSHARKLRERRFKWVVDWKLIRWTAAVVIGLVSLTTVSYAYHSNRAASTFLERADQAAKDDDPVKEVRWLRSYLLLNPNDREVIIRAALAADSAVEKATRVNLSSLVSSARKRLAASLAVLGSELDTDGDGNDDFRDQRRDLRRRYIERLNDSGVFFYQELIDQVVLLNPETDDPLAHQWIAMAVGEKVLQTLYSVPRADDLVEQTDYYRWLSQQTPGFIVCEAIRRNPGNLDLVSMFFRLLSESPESFNVILVSRTENNFKETVKNLDSKSRDVLNEVVADLNGQDDSRAKLILFLYALRLGDSDQAMEVIHVAAEAASDRLAKANLSSGESQDGEANKPDANVPAKMSPELESYLNDYLCLMQASTHTTERLANGQISLGEEVDRARKWLGQLRDIGVNAIPVSAAVVKDVYLASGLLEQGRNDVRKAIELWQEGLTVINEDNLELFGSVAWGLSQIVREKLATSEQARGIENLDDPDYVAASDAIQQFKEVIRNTKQQLIRITSQEMGLASRNEVASKIRAAEWKWRIANATLMSSTTASFQRDKQIIALLTGSDDGAASQGSLGLLDRNVELEPQVRLAGISLLAESYQRQQAWDLSAATLADAAALFPENVALAIASGQLWNQAGNRLQAMRQWQRAKLSDSPAVLVSVLEAEFVYQLRLLPERREIATLRARVRNLREQLVEYAEKGIDVSRETLRLDQLETQLPPDGVLAEQYLQSMEFATKVSVLAKSNPDNVQLQTYAAERLAAAGDLDKANEIVERGSDSGTYNPRQLSLVKARVLAAANQHEQACQTLLTFIDSDPDSSVGLAAAAAEYAARASRFDLSLKALESIPRTRRSPATWFKLYRFAQAAENGKADAYLKELHKAEVFNESKIEESNAEYSLLVLGQDLITRLLARRRIQRDDRLLVKARAVISRLEVLRPNWGTAVALRGWISFALGDYRNAIEELRRGIAAGDQRLQTRQMLWTALLAEDKEKEAATEIELASIATQTDVDPYDEFSTRKAIASGQYEDALSTSERIVNSNPNDPFAWIAHARYVLAIRSQHLAGNELAADLDPEALLDKARKAIENASKLADGGRENYMVESARLDLVIRSDISEDVESELQRIEKLEIDEPDRLLLEAKSLVALKRIDEAIDRLTEANKLRPQLTIQRLLATLLHQRGRTDETVRILRQSLAMDPSDPEIRSDLARAIVTAGMEIDWDEMSKLLSTDNEVTQQNRLMYALLLAAKGDFFQKLQAIRELRQLSGNATDVGRDAARMQAGMMMDLVRRYDSLPKKHREQLDVENLNQETRRILQSLSKASGATFADTRLYAAFLMTTGESEDLEEAGKLIDELRKHPSAAIEVLQLEMLMAKSTEQSADLPRIVGDWAVEHSASEDDASKMQLIAGEALLKSGFVGEGLQWFKQAYEADSRAFANYVVALAMATSMWKLRRLRLPNMKRNHRLRPLCC